MLWRLAIVRGWHFRNFLYLYFDDGHSGWLATASAGRWIADVVNHWELTSFRTARYCANIYVHSRFSYTVIIDTSQRHWCGPARTEDKSAVVHLVAFLFTCRVDTLVGNKSQNSAFDFLGPWKSPLVVCGVLKSSESWPVKCRNLCRSSWRQLSGTSNMSSHCSSLDSFVTVPSSGENQH